MNALFLVCERVGDGKMIETAWRPWYVDKYKLTGRAAHDCGKYYVGNIFAENQLVLDTIAADPRTVFAIPIDVDGAELSYSDEIEVHPSMRGKIIAWCAQTYGADFGQWVATNAKNRRFVAREIMSKVSGILNVDPLNGFRVYWSE